MSRKVTCYAHGHQGAWQAICYDFDIAVQGESVEEVQKLLKEAISSYVADASKEDRATRDRLLARRAPIRVRLSIAWRFAVAVVFGYRRDRDDGLGFDMLCHA